MARKKYMYKWGIKARKKQKKLGLCRFIGCKNIPKIGFKACAFHLKRDKYYHRGRKQKRKKFKDYFKKINIEKIRI